MSKIAAGVLAVLGVGTTVAASVYLPGVLANAVYELPETLQDFRERGQTKGCLGTLFGGLGDMKGEGAAEATAPSTDIGASYFTTDNKKKTEGCLLVNWDRVNYGSNKWRGSFRLLWAVKGENGKGLVVFLVGTPSANTGSPKEVKWTGIVYTLEQESDNWVFRKKHGISESGTDAKGFKKVTGGGTTDKDEFPTPKSTLTKGDGKAFGDFWGWFGSVDELENICGSGECSSDPHERKRLAAYWKWEGEDTTDSTKTTNMFDWSGDPDKWWKATFGDTKLKVKEAANKQKGEWKLEKLIQ